jgi:hypothetical protein
MSVALPANYCYPLLESIADADASYCLHRGRRRLYCYPLLESIADADAIYTVSIADADAIGEAADALMMQAQAYY